MGQLNDRNLPGPEIQRQIQIKPHPRHLNHLSLRHTIPIRHKRQLKVRSNQPITNEQDKLKVDPDEVEDDQ